MDESASALDGLFDAGFSDRNEIVFAFSDPFIQMQTHNHHQNWAMYQQRDIQISAKSV
jgi:hypothetical protein